MSHIGPWRPRFIEAAVGRLIRKAKPDEKVVFFLVNDIEWPEESLPYNEGAFVMGRRIYWQDTLGM